MGAGGLWVRTGGSGRTSSKHKWLTKGPFHESIIPRELGGGGRAPEPPQTSLWVWSCQKHTCPRSDSEYPVFPSQLCAPSQWGPSASQDTAPPQALAGKEDREGGCAAPIWAPNLSLPNCKAAPYILTSQHPRFPSCQVGPISPHSQGQ